LICSIHANSETTGNLNTNVYEWDGIPPQALSNGNVFFFGIWNEDVQDLPLFLSDYIRIIDPNAPSSSSASSTASLATTVQQDLTSSTATSTSTTSSATDSSPTTVPTSDSSTANNEDSNDSDSGTTIGIGVGVGVGGAILIIGGIFAWLWYRRHQKQNNRHQIDDAAGPQHHSQVLSEYSALAAQRDQKKSPNMAPYYDHSPDGRGSHVLEADGSDTHFRLPSPPVLPQGPPQRPHELP
jgi:hypothetical protein